MSKNCSILMLLGICLSFYAPEAKAYLDPGTGAYVFQILLGSLLGLGVFANRIIAKIRNARFLSGSACSVKSGTTNEQSNTHTDKDAPLTKS